MEGAKWVNQVETLTLWARETAATHMAWVNVTIVTLNKRTDIEEQRSIYKHNQPTARGVCTMAAASEGRGALRNFRVLFPDLSVGYTENSLLQLYAFDLGTFQPICHTESQYYYY